MSASARFGNNHVPGDPFQPTLNASKSVRYLRMRGSGDDWEGARSSLEDARHSLIRYRGGSFLSSSGDVAGLTLVLTGGVKSRQPKCSAPRRDDDGLGSARVMLGPRVA